MTDKLPMPPATTKWHLAVRVLSDPLSQVSLLKGIYHKFPKLGAKPPIIPDDLPIPYKYVESDIYVGHDAHLKYVEIFRKHPLEAIPYFFERMLYYGRRLIAFAEKLAKLDVDKLSRDEAWGHFSEFLDNYEDALAFINSIAQVDDALSALLGGIIRKRVQDDAVVDKHFMSLVIPSKDTTIFQEQQALWAIALRIFKDKEVAGLFKEPSERIITQLRQKYPELYRDIQQHSEKYAWLGFLLFEGGPFLLKDFIVRLQQLLEEDVAAKVARFNSEQKRIKEEFEKSVSFLNLAADERKIVDLAREAAFLRTHRLENYNFACYLAYPLLKRVSKEVGLRDDWAKYLIREELEAFFKTGQRPSDAIIEERRKGWAGVTLADGSTFITQGKGIDLLREKEVKVAETKFVTGQIAYKGKVTGEVVVINSSRDFPKFKKGQILVTQMTTPDFVPIMEKAKAIVTDIGGITTHAAIVSRELGVICIIGTKNATKVFKDGDMVEVDADKGIVRKI